MNDMIIGAALKSGVANQIPEVMLDIIRNFLVKNYPNMSIGYFNDAFDKYAAMKLDYQKPPFHDNFNPAFIGKVLASYYEYNRKRQMVPQRTPPSRQLENKSEDDGKISYEFIQGLYIKGEKVWIANWSGAYKYAVNNNLLNLNELEILKAEEMVKDEIQSDAKRLKETRQPYKHLLESIEKQSFSSEDNYLIKKAQLKIHFSKLYSK